jgi:hypothetical protein
MPTKKEDIIKTKKRAQTLSSEASGAAIGATTLSSGVWDAVRSDRQERGMSQLATDFGTADKNLTVGGPEVRERLGPTVDPLTTDLYTAKERGRNLGELSSLSKAEEQQYGTIDSLIQGGADQLKAYAQGKSAEAEAAAQEADDAFKMLQFESKEKQQEFENALALKKFNKDSGSDVFGDFYDDMAQLKEDGLTGEVLILALKDKYPDLTEDQIRERAQVPLEKEDPTAGLDKGLNKGRSIIDPNLLPQESLLYKLGAGLERTKKKFGF